MTDQSFSSMEEKINFLLTMSYAKFKLSDFMFLRPYTPSFLENIHQEYLSFLERREQVGDSDKWCVDFYQDDDPDDGLIVRDGTNGDDKKTFFHWRARLEQALRGKGVNILPADEMFLGYNGLLHSCCENIVTEIASNLDKFSGLDFSFAEKISEARLNPEKYCSSVLRLLHYSPQDKKQIAKDHYDRSLLTIILCDKGGVLHIIIDGEKIGIPVNEGEILVFFGEKVEVNTELKLNALKHGVTLDGLSDRFSVVFFAHANVLGIDG